MINYKIIEKEKAGDFRNYNVYQIYRNILGLKIWVKSPYQHFVFFVIAFVMLIPSLLLSCGCSDFQENNFFAVYGALISLQTIIYILYFKHSFNSFTEAEDYIKNIIRKRAKKHLEEVSDFTFDKKGNNITQTKNI